MKTQSTKHKSVEEGLRKTAIKKPECIEKEIYPNKSHSNEQEDYPGLQKAKGPDKFKKTGK